MSTAYETDVIAWVNEQAALLRAGDFSAIDIEHIAEEIEDVGRSEQRELASRMAVLLAHLLKWQFQSARRNTSWQRTIKEQRRAIAGRVKRTPSLKVSLDDPDCCQQIELSGFVAHELSAFGIRWPSVLKALDWPP